MEKFLRLGFSAINNKANYEALREGLSTMKKLRGRAMEVFSDSRLIVG